VCFSHIVTAVFSGFASRSQCIARTGVGVGLMTGLHVYGSQLTPSLLWA